MLGAGCSATTPVGAAGAYARAATANAGLRWATHSSGRCYETPIAALTYEAASMRWLRCGQCWRALVHLCGAVCAAERSPLSPALKCFRTSAHASASAAQHSTKRVAPAPRVAWAVIREPTTEAGRSTQVQPCRC
eukprot:365900-Chlamydomonas_euryale.AAC.5